MPAASRSHLSLSKRLARFLAYPAQSPTLWMICALAVLRQLNHLPSLLGLVFELAFWFMAFKMAVEALGNTAEGRYEPVPAGDLVATDGDAWEQILLQALFGTSLWAIGHFFGFVPLLFALAVAVLAMPAAVMFVAIDHSVLHAFNPLSWVEMMRRLKGAYFAAVGLVAVLTLLTGFVEATFENLLPSDMGMLPASFVAVYSLVVVYHVLGDLLHRHHAVLGLDVAPAIAPTAYASPLEDEAMAAAEAIAAEGRPADAATRLQDLFRGRGASDPVHERYRELLIAAGDLPRLAQHDGEYVIALLTTGKDKRALAVVVDTTMRVGEFRIGSDECVARLVAQALRGGQTRLAVTLAEDFETRFPGSPHLTEVLLAVAWPMADKLGQERQARSRLRAELNRNGGGPRAAELRELLARIELMPSA